MAKSCETCTKWAEHHYWDILDNQGKCFFKVLMGDLHEMTIPKKFAERFKGKISRTIKLEARSGSICDVAVKTCADKIILESGWEKFANEHELRMGDFLVFRYNGDSRFKVGIFDPSGCEKASSCVNINNHPTETIRSSNEHHSSPSLDNTMKTSSSSAHSEEPGEFRVKTSSSSANSEEPSDISGDSSSSKDDFTANHIRPYMIGSNAYLTPVQKDKVEKIVQSINSDISILVTIMSKSHVNREQSKFEFSKKYAGTYLPPEKQRVVLQRHGGRMHGRMWNMWVNAISGRWRLINGWSRFVQDNDLQIGDICLFDLLNSKKTCTMNVHIIRAVKRGRE